MNDVDRLAGLYSRAADRVRAGLMALDPAHFDAGKAAKALDRARATVKALNQASVEWADSTIDKSYEKGAQTARTILEILGKRPIKPQTYDGKRNLKDDLAETLIRANNSILKVSQDFVALSAIAAKKVNQAALQEFDFEEVEGEMTALANQAVAQELSRKDLAGQIRTELGSRISDNNLIEINGKQWDARAYADMVARTTIRDAQTAATLDLCREYDNDLVEVSDHNTECQECAPYEGQIYSISGRNPNYPPLAEAPPFHPNCEHSLLPTTDVEQDIIKAGPGTAGWIERAEWLTDAERIAIMGAAEKAAAAGLKAQQAPPKTVEWKPVMTKEEAEEWAKDSKIKRILNHNTSYEEAVSKIKTDGFVAGEGAAYGKGIYMSAIEEKAYGGYNFKLKINVQNPLRYNQSIWDKADKWYQKTYGISRRAAGIYESDAIVMYAKAMGHDALIIDSRHTGLAGRAWYNVFDKKSVTIIRVPKTPV